MSSIMTGLLIEVTSIQRFVFSTNLLKANVGASNIVDEIFIEELREAIESVTGQPFDMDRWRNGAQSQPPVDIGYIGGGNALIFTDSVERAKEIVKKFSTLLLERAPGLRTAYAIGDFDTEDFQKSNNSLFKKLSEMKKNFIPEIKLFRSGINAECPYTGEPAEVYDGEEGRFVSSTFLAMRNRRKSKFTEEIENLCDKEGFSLTDDIERFGQIKGDTNYIALVHIDGNDMGEKKKGFKELEEMRRFSCDTYKAMQMSFKDIIKETIEMFKEGRLPDTIIRLNEDNGKRYLPLRPVIIGGDDVTFISNGILGLYLTERFIKHAEERLSSYGITFSASVVISKTKYPISRAYELVESLTRRCKRIRKKKDINNSAIDFLIVTQSVSEDADTYINRVKTSMDKTLHFGPYSFGDDDERSLKAFKTCIKEFHNWKKERRTKLMELRRLILRGNKEDIEIFLKFNGLKLPIYRDYEINIFRNNTTPYFDAIDVLDFYPEELL